MLDVFPESTDRDNSQSVNRMTPVSNTQYISFLNKLFRIRAARLLGVGLISSALGCSSSVDNTDGTGGAGGAGESEVFFDCVARGSEQPGFISEFSIDDSIQLDTYEPVTDLDPATDTSRLDYVGASPLDQSTFYKCEVKDAAQCFLTVDAFPGTKYEASAYCITDQAIIDQQVLLTWPENGESALNVSTKQLGEICTTVPFEVIEKGVFIHVVSDPAGNGPYPTLLGVKDCGK